jgi:hypothetical protein
MNQETGGGRKEPVLFSSIVTIIGRTAPAHDVDVRPMNNDIRTKHAS